MIQTIQLHILLQWDQNYFLQSNILFTQYILIPVHPLNTTYIIIYLNTLWVSLCPHTHFNSPWPFPSVQNIMSQLNSKYSTTHIISMGSKLFPSVKYTFHSIYSNTTPSTKYNLHNNLFKHTLGEFMSTYPFYSSMAISTCPKCYVTTQFQHDDSNYSTTDIISMGSKLFLSVKYTFHSIYSNTSPSTKHNLWNNLFKHTLGEFMSTYPFYSSMAISPCPKNYVIATQFKLFNYTYYFNGIKIISFSQITFHSIYSNTSPSTKHNLW